MHDTRATRIELNLAKKLSPAALNVPAGSTRIPPALSGSNMLSAPTVPEHDDTAGQSPRDHDLTRMNRPRDRKRSRF
jgi:hypothetical protein